MHNRMVALVLAMVVIVPLIAAPANSSMNGASALAFEGLALLLFGMLLWRAQWDLRPAKISAFLRTGANLPILLFTGLTVALCAMSPMIKVSAQETLRLGAGVLLYFVVAYQFRRSEQVAKLMDVLLFLAIASSLVGFLQFAQGPNEYATGMFGDHQLFGSFLMLLLPLVGVIAVSEKSTNRQLTAQVATVMVAAALLLTHSRTAWIAAGASLLTLGALSLYTIANAKKASSRKHEWVLPIMLMVVALGFFLMLSTRATSILERAHTLTHTQTEDGWMYRKLMWKGAEQMIAQKPLTGFGPGVFPFAQHQYTHMGLTFAKAGVPTLSETAHSLYLEMAAELGVPGVLLFGAILVTFLVAGLRRMRDMEAGIRRNILIGTMAAIVGFAVDAVASPSWQFGHIMMFMWLTLGLGVSCLRGRDKQRDEVVEATVPHRVARPAVVFATLALAMVLPTVVFARRGGYGTHSPIEGGHVIGFSAVQNRSGGVTPPGATNN